MSCPKVCWFILPINILDPTNIFWTSNREKESCYQNYNEILPHTSQSGHHQKSTNNKCWKACGEKASLLHCWWECKFIQPLWKTVWRFLKKLGVELPYDPTIPLLGIYPEETQMEKGTCTPVFTAALFTIATTWKQPRCPSTDEWIKEL